MNTGGAAAIAAVMVAFASIAIFRARQANQRARSLPIVAARAGLSYCEDDRFNSAAVAFPLFRQGDGRVVTNVMWRDDPSHEGAPTTRVFDYAYYDEHRSDTGATTQVWHSFGCALAQHNGDWPTIRVTREGLIGRAIQRLGLPDIDFESEEFNRAFVVQCADRRFASALIDAQMMSFLLTTKGEISFETKGRFLLATTDPVPATSMPGLLAVVDEFLRRVPPAVRELYPSFPDGAGTDVFPLPPIRRTHEPGGLLGEDLDPFAPWGGSPDGAEMHRFAPASRLRDPEPDPWDPTPGVDHDLDGRPLPPAAEDAWHDHPLPP